MATRSRQEREERARTVFCKHFTGTMDNVCKAGVAYKSFADEKGCLLPLPCIQREGAAERCALCTYPTLEEQAAREERIAAATRRTVAAINAARQHAEGKRGVRGEIACPSCGGKLAYAISGYNGHSRGQCSTRGCCSWIE